MQQGELTAATIGGFVGSVLERALAALAVQVGRSLPFSGGE